MKPKLLFAVLLAVQTFMSCHNKATQVAENTFVYNGKVYKLVDNELTWVADLSDKSIRKFEVMKPHHDSLKTADLSFVKSGARATMETLYRGNFLYFKLKVEGINDLRENFYPGEFDVDFEDEYGFILHSTEIPTNELTAVLDYDNKVNYFEYNGKTEMSTEISTSIKSFSVRSTVKER